MTETLDNVFMERDELCDRHLKNNERWENKEINTNIYFMKTNPVLTRLAEVCREISKVFNEKGYVGIGIEYADYAERIEGHLERRKKYNN